MMFCPGLQAELNSATKESEFVRRRLRKLEEDLDTVKHKNNELTEELQKRSGTFILFLLPLRVYLIWF